MFDDEIPLGRAKNLTKQTFGKLTVLYRCNPPYPTKGVWWKCQCDCGKFKIVSANNLQRGHTSSCGCLRKPKPKIRKRDRWYNQRFGKLIAKEPTHMRCNGSIVWKCQCDCGNIKYVSIDSLQGGRTQSCGCLISKGEATISKLLDILSIDFISQFSFLKCKNKNPLPFDFYLPEYNCCIEYDGEQHFRPINRFGGEERFKIQQENDKIKTEYCKENDIKLIRIPYTDYNKLNEDYLLSLLEKDS